jgi:CheY-like chemotaxis protein
MTPTIRVLIVDDDALVRSALSMMLAGADGIDVVGEASDGDEVGIAVDAHQPHVVLMDIRMPRVDGIEATIRLRRRPQPSRGTGRATTPAGSGCRCSSPSRRTTARRRWSSPG